MTHETRGHVGVAHLHPQHPVNTGSIVRAAGCFDIDYVATIGGDKYTGKASDVGHSHHIPVFHYKNWHDMITSLPHDTEVVLVDYDESAYSIDEFHHPERGMYVMGSEGRGFTEEILERGYRRLYVPSEYCMNVSAAANIVLRERYKHDRY